MLQEVVSGRHERLGDALLGDALLVAQEDYATSGGLPELLSVYTLLGDPALRLR